MTFDVEKCTSASAAPFIASEVAVAALFIASDVAEAAPLAASADCLLKSSSFDCCSFILALKLATESSHHWPRSKPFLSSDADAAGGGGCGGRIKPDCAGVVAGAGVVGAAACGVAGAVACGAVAA